MTSASHPDGRMLRQVIDRQNTGGEVWADIACRSQSNEAWLDDRMLTSRIHRRKPEGKSMPKATAPANAVKSSIRARIEHVFAHQKNRFGLFIRTIRWPAGECKHSLRGGVTRAGAKLTPANLADNFDSLIFHENASPRHESVLKTGECPDQTAQTVRRTAKSAQKHRTQSAITASPHPPTRFLRVFSSVSTKPAAGHPAEKGPGG